MMKTLLNPRKIIKRLYIISLSIFEVYLINFHNENSSFGFYIQLERSS